MGCYLVWHGKRVVERDDLRWVMWKTGYTNTGKNVFATFPMESAEVDDALLHHNIGVAMQRVPIPNVTNRLNMLHDTVPRAVIEVASELAQLPPLCVVHLRPVVVADGVRVFMVVIEWRFVKSCSSMLWLHYSTLSLFVGIGNHGIVS